MSLGFLSIAGRFVVPVSGEAGLCLGVKVPFPVVGELNILPHGMGHGRPLRRDGRPVRSNLRVGRRRPMVRMALAERLALLGAWLEDAQAEHASVATLLQLERHLAAGGAPDALLQEARRAAADEADHARRCFAVVGALLGREIAAAPIAPGDTPPPSLTELAVDSLREGCLGEGVAAEQRRRAMTQAAEAIPAHLAVMSHGEARHAALAERVIAWACDTGGPAVRDAVASARAALPPTDTPRPEPDAPRWGRLSAEGQAAAYAKVRARLVG